MNIIAKIFRLPSTIVSIVVIFIIVMQKMKGTNLFDDPVKFSLVAKEYANRHTESPYYFLTCYIFSGIIWYMIFQSLQ